MTRIIVLAILLITTAGAGWFGWRLISGNKELPVLGEPGHFAGPFTFVNQAGKTITEHEAGNKVTVAEYFFTTCPGICKIMNNNLTEVYRQYKDRTDFMILSHTVDPETDSVQVLSEYARRIGATLPVWQLLTGPKETLYAAARHDYLLAVEDTAGKGTADDFIHTEYVALLDQQRRIRGFYDATNKTAMQQLIKDIKTLLQHTE